MASLRRASSRQTLNKTLPVSFMDSSSPDPLIYAGAVGEPLRMHCSADGNPSPEIEWRLAGTNGPSAVLMRNEYFIRDKIHQNDFGIYICTAKSAGYPSVSKKIILAKKSAPKIKPTEPVYAAIGSPARLPCTINAIPLPPPEGLHWFRREIILRPSSHRKFSTQEFLGGIIYVMSFSHVMSTDFGFYNCSAVNAYGSDWQTIELRRDDELSIASLSGIIAALVAAVFFALLLFFYCRRRQYPKPSLKGFGQVELLFNFIFRSFDAQCSSIRSYHLPSTTIRGSSEHAGLTAQSPSSIASTPITDQCLSVRPFSPVCKYTLIDGSGQNIPVCPNVVTFTGQPGDLHLTSEGGAALCIASDYQPIPITYVNLPAATRMASVAQEGPIAQRVGVVPATPVLPDSDIIVNTQVTDV
ncbi:unnamed protein product [Mesocestoides corti]|uniref:Ig-like domain-containing protein n=1 Tax=Mesocestoides corti TaxID=53468 RepID=A0A0R3U9S3_MESCO|nr:unnamed protein product [Mesocestoides corti]